MWVTEQPCAGVCLLALMAEYQKNESRVARCEVPLIRWLGSSLQPPIGKLHAST